ncbi:hypothetical protein OB955_05870 [Halobacteria archaeon AArc-m2/3/4]|uniref:DUF7974 domain-containing protein n=1 Tax=Natronoglomus mannanivorans TaxID=2979990 RepID=A0ABT2QBK7_9EURY|nr:hypothetical protein [Halobacteria archaeon AArc-m2/3/4]
MRPGQTSTGPDDDSDPLELDDARRGYTTRVLRTLVPQWLARRGLSVSVSTERSAYEIHTGDDLEIEFTIEVTNRLPLPVTIVTSGRRTWGWTVDGELEASDERLYTADRPNSLEFRALETKRFERTWDGRFKRTGSPTRWVEADPGEYEIGAFVATPDEPRRDSTTVVLR